LNFDIWLGPASQQPYHENIVHYNWHWFWDFGNGEIGNQGVHQMDICRWALPDGAAPRGVISLGGRFGYQDQGQTPNTQLTIIDCGEAKIFFEDRGLVNGKTSKVTNEFYMEGGVIKSGLFFPNGKGAGEELKGVSAKALNRRATLTGKLEPSSGFSFQDPQGCHFSNFIDCVRSRKRENLNAEIGEGFPSALLCHLGNLSYRLGTEVPFNPRTKALGDDKAACEALDSMKEHLVNAAHLDLADSKYHLGRKLTFDAKAEKFVDDEEANKLVTRNYRKPYVVPEEV
jgi:hypothetical protein